jgi:flagellin
MANSIQTNPTAATALQNLNSIDRTRNTTLNQQSTGRRVNNAIDNASAFTIAQLVRGDIGGFAAVEQGIDNARGVTAVALAASTAISDQLNNLQATVIAAQNPGNTSQQQAIYAQDFQAQAAQLQQTIQNASFNGRNLLSAGSTSLNVLANIDGTTLTVNSNSGFATFAADLAAQSLATTAGATQAFSALQLAQGGIASVLGNLGADQRTLNNQQGLLTAISDATATGLGAIEDADLAAVSSQNLAQQIQQQLAAQTLNIANGRPQSLLNLFR